MSKVLVAYFSASGVTAKLAKRLAEAYSVIFTAFPIWWYVAPTIVNTFLEQYDLSGKMIIPLAT